MNIKSKNIQPNNQPREAIVKPQTKAPQIEDDIADALAFKFWEIQPARKY